MKKRRGQATTDITQQFALKNHVLHYNYILQNKRI